MKEQIKYFINNIMDADSLLLFQKPDKHLDKKKKSRISKYTETTSTLGSWAENNQGTMIRCFIPPLPQTLI